MNAPNITDSPDAPLAVRSSDLLAGEPITHKPLLDRIANERDLCRNEGANDIAELLDEAGKVINDLWDESIGYGYAIQTLRRKCGISNDSTDCQEIWELIDALQNDRDRQISVTLGQMQTIRQLRKSANELACYLDEYNKQAGENHEPLYWIACRALARYKEIGGVVEPANEKLTV